MNRGVLDGETGEMHTVAPVVEYPRKAGLSGCMYSVLTCEKRRGVMMMTKRHHVLELEP